jgi:hypothetical protein
MTENNAEISWLLGQYLDGWADLIEGMGEKAEIVQSGVINQLKLRNMPDIQVDKITLKEGVLSDEYRSYVSTSTYPGARTIIAVGKHGNDLFTAWHSYIQPTINWRLIGYYASAALVIASVISSVLYLIRLFQVVGLAFSEKSGVNFITNFAYWVLTGGLICISLLFLIFILGNIWKQKPIFKISRASIRSYSIIGLGIAFFIDGYGNKMFTELNKVLANISAGISSFSYPYSFLPFAISLFGAILILALLVGFIMKKDPLAFIFKEPSIFDKDDITAMNLSVHKTLIRTLDTSGIDITKLRLKERFTSGRRGEDV